MAYSAKTIDIFKQYTSSVQVYDDKVNNSIENCSVQAECVISFIAVFLCFCLGQNCLR